MPDRGEWTLAARAAAEDVARGREAAEQLGLFQGAPGEGEQGEGEARWTGRGRKPGSRNRGKAGLAEWMAAQGYRAPGEALALAAGLTERGDPFEIAFARAAWLRAAAGLPPAPEALAQMAFAIWREMNAAAAQLLPYTLQRLAPLEAPREAGPRPSIGLAAPSVQAGVERSAGPLLAPAQVRAGLQENQGLGVASVELGDDSSDGAARTEIPSD